MYNVTAVAIVSGFIELLPCPPEPDSGKPTIFASLKISPSAYRYYSVSLSLRALSLNYPLLVSIALPMF